MTITDENHPFARVRRAARARVAAPALAALCLLLYGFAADAARAQGTPWPTEPPARVCGNATLLDGPSTPPAGAITVLAGQHSTMSFRAAGATYWFAPGRHTFTAHPDANIVAGEGATFVGAPGAVIDGQNVNRFAFTGFASGVTVRHLTIRNFGSGLQNQNAGVVNHDSGSDWLVERNTISDNDGAGVMIGSGTVVRSNCLKDNGQYGFSMFKPPVEGQSAITDIVLDGNEITGNNTDDWERLDRGCGCTGGGKFWDVKGARITRNWVHDNRGTGLWADTNNIDFLFEGNLIEGNDGEGIWYEISYNATIRHNTIRRNAWVSGRRNTGSPGAAIYLSESGGDARLPSAVSGAPELRIYGNSFEDNFSGVSIYENANRFCNSNGNTSTGYCTPFVRPTLIPREGRNTEYPNPIHDAHPCYTNVAQEPFLTDCRWRSREIKVHDNVFRFDDRVVPCAGDYCGAQALYAQGDDNMRWSPYTVRGIQDDVMFENGNRFYDNAYVGDWRFAVGWGGTIGFTRWQAAPYGQDAGSTFDGDPGDPGPGPGPGPDPGPEPPANHLDADTSSLEGSIGDWRAWYASTVERVATEAHAGRHSLRVGVTGADWGVALDNYPGVAADQGVKQISFWGKLGAASSMRPTLTVKWLDAGHAVIGSDSVTLDGLTTSWSKVSAVVDAPTGTRTAIVRLTGRGTPGESLFVDDVVVGDAPNALNAASSGFEGGLGVWASHYSAEVSASTAEAYRGSGSLKVGVTAPFGWGVAAGNWPGFRARPGAKRVSFWAKRGAGTIATVTLRVHWLDAAGATVETTAVPLGGLTADWRQAVASVTAPAAAASAYLDVRGAGGAGDVLHLDELVVTDQQP